MFIGFNSLALLVPFVNIAPETLRKYYFELIDNDLGPHCTQLKHVSVDCRNISNILCETLLQLLSTINKIRQF